MAMATNECEPCEKIIAELTDERGVLKAQRDHYSERCDELTGELSECRAQLNNKLDLSKASIDSAHFKSETIERLEEWKECLALCVEEKKEEMERERRRSGEGIGEKVKAGGKKGKVETELPFSQGNLAGLLTRNHRLTQKYTEYPEPRAKKG